MTTGSVYNPTLKKTTLIVVNDNKTYSTLRYINDGGVDDKSRDQISKILSRSLKEITELLAV
jgi:hypothetical protein